MNMMEVFYLILATFRITKVISKDAIFANFRRWFGQQAAINDKYQPIRQKLAELISCPHCLGVWVAGFLYIFRKPLLPIIKIFMIAGLQSLLQSADDRLNEY